MAIYMQSKKMAFISRHVPTKDQKVLAKIKGYDLIHIGDRDAFTVKPDDPSLQGIDAVAVVHPAAALRLIQHFDVGVFENNSRMSENGVPTFSAGTLHIWDSRCYN